MKKFLAILMAIFMLVSLCACDRKKGGNDGDEKIVSAIFISDGMVWTNEITLKCDDATLVQSYSYFDDDSSCIISDKRIYFLEKDGNVYVVMKATMQRNVIGENSDEYRNSLDPDEDSMEIAMLEKGGFILDDMMMEAMGLKGMSFDFTYDLERGIIKEITTKTADSTETNEFLYSGAGRQIGVNVYRKSGKTEEEYSCIFSEFHSNGLPKTVEWDFGDGDTRTDRFTDQGYRE